MPDRRPARLLAPLALVAFVIVLVLVIASAGGGGGSSSEPSGAATKRPPAARRTHVAPRRYVVQSSDDSLDEIAGKTGVPAQRLLELNPDLDPQALVPGQPIRLRP